MESVVEFVGMIERVVGSYDHLRIFHDIEIKNFIVPKCMEILHGPQCTCRYNLI